VPNFPDPIVGADGDARLPDNVRIPAAAKTACASVAREGNGKGIPTYSPAQIAQLRKLAQCFRAHGISDWPDPDAAGAFPLNDRLRNMGKRAWLPARDACKQYFVGKGMVVSKPKAGS
jgi:hypothetical protein